MAESHFSSGHVGIVGVVKLRPAAVAKGSCAAARSQENGVPDTEAAFLDGSLCPEPSNLGDVDLDDST